MTTNTPITDSELISLEPDYSDPFVLVWEGVYKKTHEFGSIERFPRSVTLKREDHGEPWTMEYRERETLLASGAFVTTIEHVREAIAWTHGEHHRITRRP